MKRKTISVFRLLLISWLLIGSTSAFAFDCKQVTKNYLLSNLPNSPLTRNFIKQAKIVHKRKVDNICECILDVNGRFLPVYVGNDFVVFGKMYSKGVLVSRDIIQKMYEKKDKEFSKLFLKYKKDFDKLAVITYKPTSSAKKILYMVTDPLCPYCHKAESKIKDLVKRYNVILKIVLFSVHGPKGKRKAEEAICKNFNLDQYFSDKWRDKQQEKIGCKKGKEILKQTFNLVGLLGIKGVPTFIFEDGTKVVGANLLALEAMLRERNSK